MEAVSQIGEKRGAQERTGSEETASRFQRIWREIEKSGGRSRKKRRKKRSTSTLLFAFSSQERPELSLSLSFIAHFVEEQEQIGELK